MFSVDWHALFVPSGSLLELIIRGSCLYWFLFLLLRFVMRRDVGSVGVADVLLLVIIADAAQNAMAGEYRSITEGLVLVSTIIGWNYLFNWAAYHSRAFARFSQPQPLLLIRDGKLLHRNMRREYITERELQAKMREQGIEDFSEVKQAFMEEDGEVSVIKKTR